MKAKDEPLKKQTNKKKTPKPLLLLWNSALFRLSQLPEGPELLTSQLDKTLIKAYSPSSVSLNCFHVFNTKSWGFIHGYISIRPCFTSEETETQERQMADVLFTIM